MGQVVHRQGELKALGRPARFAGTAVLQAGIEHQGVDWHALLQQRRCQLLHAGQIGQIAEGPAHLILELAFRQQLTQRVGPGLAAAGQGEPVACRSQLLGSLQTDAGTGAGDQDVAALHQLPARCWAAGSSPSAGCQPRSRARVLACRTASTARWARRLVSSWLWAASK